MELERLKEGMIDRRWPRDDRLRDGDMRGVLRTTGVRDLDHEVSFEEIRELAPELHLGGVRNAVSQKQRVDELHEPALPASVEALEDLEAPHFQLRMDEGLGVL